MTILYLVLLMATYGEKTGLYADIFVFTSLVLLFMINDWHPRVLIYAAGFCLLAIPFLPNLEPPHYLGDPLGVNILGKYAFYLLIIYVILVTVKWQKIAEKKMNEKRGIVLFILLSLFILFHNEYWARAHISVQSPDEHLRFRLDPKDSWHQKLSDFKIRRDSDYSERENLNDQKHYVGFSYEVTGTLQPKSENINCIAFQTHKSVERIRGTGFDVSFTPNQPFADNGNVLIDQDENPFDWTLGELDKKTYRAITGTKKLACPNCPRRESALTQKNFFLCFQPRSKADQEGKFLFSLEITFGRPL